MRYSLVQLRATCLRPLYCSEALTYKFLIVDTSLWQKAHLYQLKPDKQCDILTLIGSFCLHWTVKLLFKSMKSLNERVCMGFTKFHPVRKRWDKDLVMLVHKLHVHVYSQYMYIIKKQKKVRVLLLMTKICDLILWFYKGWITSWTQRSHLFTLCLVCCLVQPIDKYCTSLKPVTALTYTPRAGNVTSFWLNL